MDTIGWLLILGAGFLIRAVSKGRSITDLPGDIGDAFTAAVSGDGKGLSEVLARTGTGLKATPSVDIVGAADTIDGVATGASLLTAMHKRGAAAKGYKLTATGPDYYDCSGLVWKACEDIGVYTGPRFTTSTFQIQAAGFTKPVTSPLVGDIVLWPRHHMGVVDGAGTFYSALNKKSGIRSLAIKSITGNGTPVYYRINYSLAPDKGDYGNGLGVLK